ncbi:MAG: Inner membrane protein YqiK [uncultured Sulfurovum sp.]|uniref:Inner membrane protein YqiK n=1 Tax=uncultured Sulfurovum sp. TaxID=269237 RepID=A0A6S6U659_9BACT|nr:MAG: Inner membrane protein YqiK [uncultured Sulfurovum sp.]
MNLLEILNGLGIYAYALGVVLLVLILGIMFVRLYKKTTKEKAFIRTGLGGAKVILDGGSIILPMVHDQTIINLNTLKLVVTRQNEQSLITSDKLKVDVIVEFFVRVKRDEDSISRAAATLGSKTLRPEDLKNLIEGKLVDAIRSVASRTTMESLHVERKDFVQQVSNTVAEDLDANGLELESVSLTSLDQTHIKYFNENNAFDAQGLRKVAEITEAKRKERIDIEEETKVQIELKKLEAEKKILTIREEEALARASQESNTRIDRSKQSKEAEESEILNAKSVAFANIQKDKEIQEREILKTRKLETDKIQKEEALKLAQQEKEIKISEKSSAVAMADAKANLEKAKEVTTQEAVTTARETEIANRDKSLALIKAMQVAEEEAVGKKLLAQAEKEAAEDKADARKIGAHGEAESIKIISDAKAKEHAVEAEGQKLLNDALNSLSPEQIKKEIQLSMIERLPEIIEQMIKPANNIDSIKIVDMGNGGKNLMSNTQEGDNASKASLPEQITNAMMNYSVGSTMINDMLKESGLSETVGVSELQDFLNKNTITNSDKSES